jgi:hypothetical protein
VISKSDMTELEDLLAEEGWGASQASSTGYLTPPIGDGGGASGTPALATTPAAAGTPEHPCAGAWRHGKADDTRGVLVFFEFTHPTAGAVGIAGTFNHWRPEAAPMIPWGHSRWLNELSLPPGTYEYCLVVDGQWLPDPLAREAVPNPFGGMNSVLKVEPA